MDDAPALCRDRWTDWPAVGDPAGLGPIARGVDCYLRQLAAAVRDGDEVSVPHLGRLRRAGPGRVRFDPAPGLLGDQQ
jgi:hypothetical protein